MDKLLEGNFLNRIKEIEKKEREKLNAMKE